jgi:glycine cleavage system transcriptional repressor
MDGAMPANSLLLLATGPDRPGIVDRVTRHIYESGCNLEDSRMALLGGEFALMVLLTGGPENLRRVEEGLGAVARELGLTVQLKPAAARAAGAGGILYRVTAVALDHPGIVHKLSSVLAAHRANVVRLDTTLGHAPVSGAPVFSLEMEVEVPADLALGQLRAHLMEAAAAENIDLELRALRS